MRKTNFDVSCTPEDLFAAHFLLQIWLNGKLDPDRRELSNSAIVVVGTKEVVRPLLANVAEERKLSLKRGGSRVHTRKC